MSTQDAIKIQYFNRKLVGLAFFCLYMIPFGIFTGIRGYEYFTSINAEITKFDEFCSLTVAKGNMKHPPSWDMPCEKALRFQNRDPNSTDFAGLPDWPIRHVFPAAIATLAVPFEGGTVERTTRLGGEHVLVYRTANTLSVRPLQWRDQELVVILDRWHILMPILVFLGCTFVIALGVFLSGRKSQS